VQENLRKFQVHTTQVSCSRKWLYPLEKSDIQSIVQSAAVFHDRNLPEIKHVLLVPVSGASFLYQKNGARNPVHTGKLGHIKNIHLHRCKHKTVKLKLTLTLTLTDREGTVLTLILRYRRLRNYKLKRKIQI